MAREDISEFGKKVKYVDGWDISVLVHGKLLLLLFILLPFLSVSPSSPSPSSPPSSTRLLKCLLS